ncbi:MAG: hypothetical protein WDN76_07760 [Alphaproteobacteria bacterium]
MDLLNRLAREKAIAQIFVSLGSVAATADKIAVLFQGSVVEAGPTYEVLLRPSHPYTRKLLEAVPKVDLDLLTPPGESARHKTFGSY